MKFLVLGDIHGRTIWKDIIEKENPDKVIFLGDYVSTHEDISSDQQCSNLEDILDYKEENPDKTILLRGNHCLQHLGYYWAQCSGWNPKVWQYMSKNDFKERFLKLTQWVYIIPRTNIVCSHAGIGQHFLQECSKRTQSEHRSVMEQISEINRLIPSELFGFTSCKFSDYTGESSTQPCTWIRPYTLLEHGVKAVTHVVGHTPIKHICNVKDACIKLRNELNITEEEEKVNNYCNIWCCDNLEVGEYLIIEDGEFKPCKL